MKIKKFIKIIIFYAFLLSLSFLNTNSYSDERICENNLIDHIIKFGERNFEYNELRNDAGIHFAYDWDRKNNKIIVKRDKNNYPIIRYSLFDNKNFIPNKTVVKKINSIDLSSLNDKDLIKQTYLSGNINFELGNKKNITISSRPYKLNDFKLSNFEILSIQNIDTTKGILEMSFTSQFTNIRNDLKKDLKDTDFLNNSSLH